MSEKIQEKIYSKKMVIEELKQKLSFHINDLQFLETQYNLSKLREERELLLIQEKEKLDKLNATYL
jgi:hypothetical protein